jgi:predicted SprT family Zn-dependent metalloprotease
MMESIVNIYEVNRERIRTKTKEFFDQLSDYFGIPSFYYDVNIMFSNRMTKCAGMASCHIDPKGYTSDHKIKFSNKLFERCNEIEQDQTIAHEVCHMFEYKLYGKGGHKDNWKEMMVVLGYEPNRCHKIDTTGLKRRQRRYLATCACQEHQVSGRVRTNILKKGNVYSCTKCGTNIHLEE